jgi:hypothetical protein
VLLPVERRGVVVCRVCTRCKTPNR